MKRETYERVIEDIFVADKAILAEVLTVNPSDLSLVARQKSLRSGKLDLLLLYQSVLILVELKVTPFSVEMIDQINNYELDLLQLQAEKKLIAAPIKKLLLVTSFSSEAIL